MKKLKLNLKTKGIKTGEEIAQELHDNMISILNQLYLYARVGHNNSRDYKEVIDGLRKKYPELRKRITGGL